MPSKQRRTSQPCCNEFARGESFTITRHGAPVAQLVPVPKHDPERINAAIQRLKELSARLTLGGDWREFRDAGRKW